MSEQKQTSKQLMKNFKKNFSFTPQDNVIVHDFNDTEFKNEMFKLLTRRGSVNSETVNQLLDDEGIKHLKVAFTHESFSYSYKNNELVKSEERDYELYETMGDVTVNKCVVWYLVRRFPQLKKNTNGNQVITELKKNLVSKKIFSDQFKRLNLNNFIRYKEWSYTEKSSAKKIMMDMSMMEDVFEAMMGAIEDLIDGRIMVNTGYSVVYNIVSSILDEIKDISLDLEDIIDSKTKIQEIIHKKSNDGWSLRYDEGNKDDNGMWIVKLTLVFKSGTPNNSKPVEITFEGIPARQKIISQTSAAQKAIDYLKKEFGIVWTRPSSVLK